jgi:hypothetical protein
MTKISGLTAATAATTDDFLVIADDPLGTPVSKKITFDNFQKSITAVGTVASGSIAAILPTNVPTSVASDSGTATPATNSVTIAGGEGIDTSGATSVVTIAGEDASTTNKGIVELATYTEIDTGTDTGRAMAPDQFVASSRNVEDFIVRVVADATDTAAASTTALGGDLEFPYTGTIIAVGAYNDTAGTTGTATYDIHLGGTTIMASTKISIETGEKSSRTATTQPTLSTTAITAGDILTFFCDAVQSGTAAKGLSFRVSVRKT